MMRACAALRVLGIVAMNSDYLFRNIYSIGYMASLEDLASAALGLDVLASFNITAKHWF